MDHPNQSDDNLRLTDTGGKSPNLVAMSSAIAALAAPTDAAAKSDTANTDGRLSESLVRTAPATSALPPKARHICGRNGLVWLI